MKKAISLLVVITTLACSFSFQTVPETYAASVDYYSRGCYITSALHSGKAVDINGGNTYDGTKIQLWDFNRTSAQGFKLEKVGRYYVIRHSVSGKVLDVDGAKAKSGTRVHLWTYHGGNNQKWELQGSNGYYRFKSALGNFYLDVNGASTNNGTQIQIWTSNSTNAQKFRLQDDITYTYRTYRLNFSTFDGWRKAMESSQRAAMGLGSKNVYNGLIMGCTVLKYKTITVKQQYGQNVGQYRNVRVSLPHEIQYTIHTHHYSKKVIPTFEYINVQTTCSCGFFDIFTWEIPWPNTSDTQTTDKIIKALPKIQVQPNYAYW